MSDIDADMIRHALKTAREFGFRSVRIKSGEVAFSSTLAPDLHDHTGDEDENFFSDEAAVTAMETEGEVTASAVGYFTAEASLKPGSPLQDGTKVGVITALGLPNDVTSNTSGEVTEVLAKTGQAVEFGQVLVRFRRNA